jgi:hypothetical protein
MFNQRSNPDFIKVYLMMLSCLHTSLRITDEEELSGTSKTIGCCDRDEIEIIAYPDTYKVLQGYGAVILGALWVAKSTTLKAASKLTMSSHCLRYIPAAIRKQYLHLVAQAVAQAAAQAEWSQSK